MQRKMIALCWWALIVLGIVAVWLAYRADRRQPKPISLEQQNRVLKLQIEGYKAAVQWKYGELKEWEILGRKVDPTSLTSASMAALVAAQKQEIAGKSGLDNANVRIAQVVEELRKSDRCEKCVATEEFKWASVP